MKLWPLIGCENIYNVLRKQFQWHWVMWPTNIGQDTEVVIHSIHVDRYKFLYSYAWLNGIALYGSMHTIQWDMLTFCSVFCWKCSINFSLIFFEVSRTDDMHKLLTYCKWSTPGKYGRIYFTMILVIEKLVINARAMSFCTSLLPFFYSTGDPLPNLDWMGAMCPNRN